MIRGQGGQVVGAQLIDATTGANFVGTVTVYIDGDHTGQVIGSVGAGVANARGHGSFDYLPTAGETDFAHVAFTFTAPGAVSVTVEIDTLSPAQVSALQSASGLASVAASVIVIDALTEIRVVRPGDGVAPELLEFGLGKLNRLLDRWNANPRASYVPVFASYTPTPSLSPHTIGPSSATWTVTQRPSRIRAANLVLNTVSPAVRIPIHVRDKAWWQRQPVQGLATTFPTDLYYQPDWPNGSVYLWPVPTSTYPIELVTDGLFGVLTLTDTVWMPFGYRDAVTLTLAEELAPACGQTVNASTQASAREARALIFAANSTIPNLRTRDAGMPGVVRGTYDYRTGFSR